MAKPGQLVVSIGALAETNHAPFRGLGFVFDHHLLELQLNFDLKGYFRLIVVCAEESQGRAFRKPIIIPDWYGKYNQILTGQTVRVICFVIDMNV